MDNLRRTGKGGFLVGVPVVIDDGFNPIVDVLAKYPTAQRLLNRLIYLVGRLPEIIDEYYPHPRLREFAYWTRGPIQHSNGALSFCPKKYLIYRHDGMSYA